jgi:hypothetical protein
MVDLKSLLGKLNSTCRQALEKEAARLSATPPAVRGIV